MYRSSSHAAPVHSLLSMSHTSSSARPVLMYSPFENEQHSRRSSSALNSWTLTKQKICVKNLRTRKTGTWFARNVTSSASRQSRIARQCVPSCGPCAPPSAVEVAVCVPAPRRAAAPPRAALGAWMQLPSCGVISRFTLSRRKP